MGGGSGGRAKTQTPEQGRELPVDRHRRVFQVRVGRAPQAKDGTVGVLGVERHPQRPENPADVPDGRRERILQQTRDQDVERVRGASLFHQWGYQSQCGGTI